MLHKYIKPFTDEVVVHSRTIKDGVTNVESLEELFDSSDIVFVCVPLSNETEGSITEEIMTRNTNRMLVNVARGKVIDEEGLFNSLKQGNLTGFASDVWYQYPTRENPIVAPSKFDFSDFNVVMTPHCGGFADDSQTLRFIDTLNQISNKR